MTTEDMPHVPTAAVEVDQNASIPAGGVTEVGGSFNPLDADFVADPQPVKETPSENFTSVEPPLPKGNINWTTPPISSIPGGKLTNDRIYVVGPAHTSGGLAETIAMSPVIDPDASKTDRHHTQSMTVGTYFTPAQNQFAGALGDISKTWKQGLTSPKGNLLAGVPRYAEERGDRVSGQRAVMRIRAQTGQGTYLTIPLFHSGFWITLKAPMRFELDELFRTIEATKVNVANNSYALALGNSATYLLRPIMDLIGRQLHDISVKGVNFDWIMDNTSSLDIPWIIAHLAHMVWRRGYQYAHACINDVQSCANVITELIEIGKCALVADDHFTEYQRAHMTKREGSSMTVDEVKRYKSDFPWHVGRSVDVPCEDGVSFIKFYLKDMSVSDYIAAGVRWVERLEASVSKTISQTEDLNIRNAHLNRAADVTGMMEYSHWVSYIDLGDGQIVDDRETIDTVLMDQSGDKKLVESFGVEVRKLIDDCTIALIAAPVTKCPLCQKEDIENGDLFKGTVAMDTLSTFFTLLSQEIIQEHRIRTRG